MDGCRGLAVWIGLEEQGALGKFRTRVKEQLQLPEIPQKLGFILV